MRWARLSHENQRRRTAFTLLELLLVLALIAVLFSIVVPSLRGSLKTWRLRSAADQVRTAWIRARTDAIRDGEIYVFRFIPETGRYMVAPWLDGSELPVAVFEQAALDTSDELRSPVPRTTGGEPDLSRYHDLAELPDDVNLLAVEFAMQTLADRTASPASASPASSVSQQNAQAGAVSNDGWSPPILFFPDGTSSAAVLYVGNDCRQLVPVTLRAMTGSARVGEVEVFNGRLR